MSAIRNWWRLRNHLKKLDWQRCASQKSDIDLITNSWQIVQYHSSLGALLLAADACQNHLTFIRKSFWVSRMGFYLSLIYDKTLECIALSDFVFQWLVLGRRMKQENHCWLLWSEFAALLILHAIFLYIISLITSNKVILLYDKGTRKQNTLFSGLDF
jgi:hypothetical protein